MNDKLIGPKIFLFHTAHMYAAVEVGLTVAKAPPKKTVPRKQTR